MIWDAGNEDQEWEEWKIKTSLLPVCCCNKEPWGILTEGKSRVNKLSKELEDFKHKY